MDVADLRVFEAVARLGAMSRAAAELHTVQSNVTARVRALERELGVPLFQRSSRGVALTAPGRRLLAYAGRVRHLLADARRAVEDDGDPAGPLTIGALETTAALRLSPLLASYVAAHPAVDLVLRTGTTRELVESVLEQRVECAFVCGPVGHPALAEEPVFREELAILTAPSIRTLAQALRARDLKIIVLRAGCSYRERLEAILAGHGVAGLRQLEFGTLEAIVGCVSAGLGLTLLPKALIGTVWPAGRVAVHELPPAQARVDTVLVRGREAFVSSALAGFLSHVLASSAPLPARRRHRGRR
jgi:DNA-binding transcriptional LysR family regulator